MDSCPSFYNFQIIYVIQTTTQCVCFTVLALIINIRLALQKLKTNDLQLIQLKFLANLTHKIIHTPVTPIIQNSFPANDNVMSFSINQAPLVI